MTTEEFFEVAGWLALTLLFFACMIFGSSTVIEGSAHFVASLI